MAAQRNLKRSLNGDREYLATSIDTGQASFPFLDTGQGLTRLEVLSQDIHRTDNIADGTEVVMSTLRKFNLRVGLIDQDGNVDTHEDGMKLTATLIFENGNTVTDLSQSMEPPLLGGEAIIDKGEANFELRITVLSSLCRGNKFRVQVTAIDQPNLRTMTGPMRTITKLHRTPVSKAKCQKTSEATNATNTTNSGGIGPLSSEPDLPLEWPASLFDEFGPAEVLSAATEAAECEVTVCAEKSRDELQKSRDELWAEVTANGNLILELQSKQAALFEQLRMAMSCASAMSSASKETGDPSTSDATSSPLKNEAVPPPLWSSASFTSALPEVFN